MKKNIVEEGVANWERLQKFVSLAEEASPSLKRFGERFSRRLAASQAKNLARIMENPDSREYKDYIEFPERFS
ncbi:MAG: hypothetical protein IJU44_01160 [Kiritimatiellae bacterium]|nr:hypothetical protein [Kiritimatiellia bacterium]